MSRLNKTGAAGAICSVAVIIGLVLSSGEVKTSRAGLELIGNAEGCRRDPYKCPA
ncbi:lysozyme, partial [Serratia marcescens]|nr:lysozyme [Serratia marcescens]MDQ9428363.1 lysozyme [Serratia marcescens]MDQ9429732.1 lysozyme [Serratia marcescens]MDQ9477792.1 lysozyme [Serratia marcescens]MDQ9542122.1 lysozyme [Serratia marcescens]